MYRQPAAEVLLDGQAMCEEFLAQLELLWASEDAATLPLQGERTGDVVVKFKPNVTLADVGDALADSETDVKASTAESKRTTSPVTARLIESSI